MFSFMLSLLVLSLMFSLIGGAAHILRGTLLRGREGVMYPFWVIILLIVIFPLRLDLSQLPIPFADMSASEDAPYTEAQQSEYSVQGAQITSDCSTPEKGTAAKSENPIVLKLRRVLAASAYYVDEVSAMLFILWLAGALFSFGGTLMGYYCASHLMKRNSTVCTDERVIRIADELRRKLHIRRRIRVRIFELESLSSPCVSGICLPTLYVESGCIKMNERELECTLLHELTHIRRFDTAAKLFCFFATSVHWFNPTAYRVRRTMLEDCELSCDYSVINTYGSSVSGLYMSTILNFAERYSESCRLICREGYGGGLFISSSSGVSFLKRRYANMKNFRKSRHLLILISAFTLVCLLANTVALSSCAGITEKTLGSAIELTPPVDAMVRAYYDLDGDDYITPEMVDGITSLKVEAVTYTTASEDKAHYDELILAEFTVNGSSSFTRALAPTTHTNYMEKVIRPALAEYSEKNSEIDPYTDEKKSDVLGRFMAFQKYADRNDPTLTDRAERELLATYPELEQYDSFYVLDPLITEREKNMLYLYLEESGLLNAWALDSAEFDASSFGYFENLEEVEFVGLTPIGYEFPDNVKLTLTEIKA